MEAISGVRPETPFWEKLQKDECKTLQEFYRRVDKIIFLETDREAVHARRSTSAEAPHEFTPAGKFMPAEKNRDSKKCKSGDRPRSPDAHQKKAKSCDHRVPRPLRASTITSPTWWGRVRMYFLPQSTRACINDPIRCRETARRGTRINTIDFTEISATPQKNASPSKTRLRSSSEMDTSRTTSTTGAPSPMRTSDRQDLIAKSEPSSADCTSPGRREEPKTATSERPGKGHLRLWAFPTSDPPSRLGVRWKISPSVREMRATFTIQIVMHWLSRPW